MSTIEPEVPINFEAVAEQHVGAMQAMHEATMQQLGGGVFIGPVSRRKLTSTANLPDKFFKVIGKTLEEQPLLASVSPQLAAKTRRVVPLSEALTLIAESHEFLARSCRETIAVRRSEVGEEALRVYGVAKSYNRVRDLEQFIPHANAMKDALGARGRRVRKTPPSDDAPVVTAKEKK